MMVSILERIQDFYVSSSDFNGIAAESLSESLEVPWPALRTEIGRAITAGDAEAAFASHCENPHIKRIPALPVAEQIVKLAEEHPAGICLYPTERLLRARMDAGAHAGCAYSGRLLLGEPQLTPAFFELGVLERYFRDPRYAFAFEDSSGSIAMKAEDFGTEAVQERDQVFLQTFGIGYDKNRSRVVAVFLRYLHRLSPEHQQYWQTHEVASRCTMNSDYTRATLWGAWPEYWSAYRALLQEQVELNRLGVHIAGTDLFRRTFVDERPKGFAPMLRPTTRNFDEFAHLLDKMLSDNIARDFFTHESAIAEQVGDRTTGTLALFESWLRHCYQDAEGKDVARDVLEPLRRVRTLRQPSAHAVREDAYDPTLPRKQDELVGDVVQALQRLRWMLSSHPRARAAGYAPPEWLDGDKIVFY